MDNPKEEILAEYGKALLEAKVTAAQVREQLAGLKAGPALAAVQERRARARGALARAVRSANPV